MIFAVFLNITFVAVLKQEVAHNPIVGSSFLKYQILFLLESSPNLIDFHWVWARSLIQRCNIAWEKSCEETTSYLRNFWIFFSVTGSARLKSTYAAKDATFVLLLAFSDKNLINDVVEHLDDMVWIVV